MESRATAEVDLDAIASNLEVLRRRLSPTTALVLVVKADAYGLGAIPITARALASGADAVAVTTPSEALELRLGGLRARTLVLGPVAARDATAAVRFGAEFAVSSRSAVEVLEEVAREVGVMARVHVKVDTGMGRLGASPRDSAALLQRVRESRRLQLTGLMTHLGAVDGAFSPSASAQLATFEQILRAARDEGTVPPERDVVHAAGLPSIPFLVHALNSAAVLSGLRPTFDAVRVGIAAYGVAPHPSLAEPLLRPALSVHTRIAHLSIVEKGSPVGYAGTWRASRPSRIAVLPVGYADGLPWRLGNRGGVLVRGRRAPLVGRVSMDYATIDVTDVPGAMLGDRATIIGSDGEASLRIEDVADLAGSIPHEIMCSIGKRVERTYVEAPARRTTEHRALVTG